MRKFLCADCNTGFRTHGVLAKHLRTKNHVKVLTQQGKLPEDALVLIKDNINYLSNVDATSCKTARLSILKILEQLRNGSDLKIVERDTSSPELAIGISQKHTSAVQPQKPTSFVGHKRKNSERSVSLSSWSSSFLFVNNQPLAGTSKEKSSFNVLGIPV